MGTDATVLSHESEDGLFGVHNRWFIRLNGRIYYVSHQGDLPFFGPECMAFDAAEVDGQFIVADWADRAVSHRADPVEAFNDVIEQLERA